MNTPSVESFWQCREEVIFPKLFGPVRRGIFALSVDLFTKVFRQAEVDPRRLHYGVLEFAPAANRGSRLYATSGASNPSAHQTKRHPS